MVKYNIGLKVLLQQGISVPIFYGDLVYKFKIIVRNPNFRDQFKKIIKRYKKKMDITWISCDSLHAWFQTQSRVLAVASSSMGDRSQFSPLTTLSEQLGPNSWVSSVFIPAFIANIGKHFFLKYYPEYSKSI